MLVGVMTAAGVAGAAPIAFHLQAIADDPDLSERDPEIHGDLMAYTIQPFMGTVDVQVVDFSTETLATIGSGDGKYQSSPDVSCGRVVYEDDAAGESDIRVWDTWLDVDYAVAETADTEADPRISGNLVVWHNLTDGTLWYRDLARGFSAIVPGVSNVEDYDVDNGHIVATYPGISSDIIGLYEPGITGDAPEFILNTEAHTDITTVQTHGDRLAYTVERVSGGDTDARFTELRGNWIYDPNPDSAFNEGQPVAFHRDMAWQTDIGGDLDVLFSTVDGEVSNVSHSASTDDHGPSMNGRWIGFSNAPAPTNNDVWMADAETEVVRTAGADRYATAVALSKAYFDGAKNVVLCTGSNFPDALCGGAACGQREGALLLTRRDELPEGAASLIGEYADIVVEVQAYGGTSVIDESVLDEVRGLIP